MSYDDDEASVVVLSVF